MVGMLAMALSLVSCGGGPHSCTAVGCEDGVSFSLSGAPSVWKAGHYVIQLTGEGARKLCSFDISSDPGSAFAGVTCDNGSPGFFVGSSPDAPPSQIMLSFSSHPKTLSVAVSRDGTDLLNETSPPLSYAESQPNGPDCGPPCRLASYSLILTA